MEKSHVEKEALYREKRTGGEEEYREEIRRERHVRDALTIIWYKIVQIKFIRSGLTMMRLTNVGRR